jgi:hypothetical protein
MATRDATHHPGQPIHLAQERAKQAANRAIERLREDGVVPEVVEKPLSLLERSLPLLELEACEVLMKARLCFTRLSCEALLAAAKCLLPPAAFRNDAAWFLWRPGGDGVRHLWACVRLCRRIDNLVLPRVAILRGNRPAL